MSGFVNLPGSISGLLAIKSTRLQPTTAPTAPKEGELYYDITLNTLLVYNGSDFVSADGLEDKAMGGIITTYSSYKVHTFLTSGTFTPLLSDIVPPTKTFKIAWSCLHSVTCNRIFPSSISNVDPGFSA